MDKRDRWFDDGAPLLRGALEAVGLADRLPPAGDFYACPCCLTAYPREAIAARVLTEEHIPPRGLGGRGLLLTCQRCNNSSGTDFDAHAIRGRALDHFVSGLGATGPLRVTFYADGIPMRGTAERTGDGYFLVGVHKQNDPKVEAAHFQALESMTQDNSSPPSLKFTIGKLVNPYRAKVSWIRSAYLAAFAVFGWRYILRPVFDPIRAQFANAETDALPPLYSYDPNSPTSHRQVLVVEAPEDIRSVLVVMGQHSVFLPGLWEALSCDELSRALEDRVDADGRLQVRLTGQEAEWPARPLYLLDLASS